jgi:hypothetical protein
MNNPKPGTNHGMTGAGRTGATAAAVLPAALAGALLVSAPFAGTTTAPLATSRPSASVQSEPPQQTQGGLGSGAIATLAASEIALLGVGAGVIVYARRRRSAEA